MVNFAKLWQLLAEVWWFLESMNTEGLKNELLGGGSKKSCSCLLNLIQDSGLNHQPILRPSTAGGFEVPKWSLSNCQDAVNLDEKPEKVGFRGRLVQKPPLKISASGFHQV